MNTLGDRPIPEQAIEAAAIALYEHTREPNYTGVEWDWPNIDRSYDKPDETVTDPEWLRNGIRSDARVVLEAALPVLEASIRARIADEIRGQRMRLMRSHGIDEFGEQHGRGRAYGLDEVAGFVARGGTA